MKGNWNNNEKSEFVRTGTKSSRLTATQDESLLIGTYSCIQVPAIGNYKIKIMLMLNRDIQMIKQQ